MVTAAAVSTAAGIMATRTANLRTMTTLLDLQARAPRFVGIPGGIIGSVSESVLVNEAGFSWGDS